MGYIICEKCGGYYKLEKGESFEDFDKCQCGGNLRYVKSIPKERNKPKNTIKCTICGYEQEKGLVCSKCGSKIRIKVNHQSRDYRNRYNYKHLAEDDLFNRIELNGIKSGILFYILTTIIIHVIQIMLPGFLGLLGLGLVTQGGTQNVSGVLSVGSIVSAVITLIYIFIPVSSGFVAVNEITTEDYVTGMVNGGLVGVIMGIILGFLSLIAMWIAFTQMDITVLMILVSTIAGIVSGGIASAAGGLISVYVKRHTSFVLRLSKTD
ncbi:MAG: hypothetical protein ABFC34_05370 [Methanobacterium sp.]